ncbi:MAG: AAA family ATPase [Chloroflexi bacterium]|nr:AAA family ATPase [Chloroflexota bacterium]
MAEMSLFLGHDFDRALNPLDERLKQETTEAVQRLCANRFSPGLHDELLHRLSSGLEVRSARVTRAYRLVFARHESRIVVLWVDNHDEAYNWADRHRREIPRRFERTNLRRVAGGPAPVPRVAPEDPVPVPNPDLLDEMAARGFEQYFAALDDDQRYLVEYDERKRQGLMFVTAGAGTGKTSIAIWRALRQATQQEQDYRGVLYLCFNRVLMKTVRNTIDTLAPPEMASQIEVQTFHGWADAYLQKRVEGFAVAAAIDTDGQWLKRAITEEFPRLSPSARDQLPGWSAQDLHDEISNVLAPNQFDDVGPYMNLTRPESEGLRRLRQPQRRVIWELHQRIRCRPDAKGTWDDLIARGREALASDADPPIYRAVIVDEAQDCSPVMARLARTLVAGEEWRLLVLADPAQLVYRGRFRWAKREFSPRGSQARVMLRPYRSTRQIHALAASLYADVDEMRREVGQMAQAQREGPLPRLVRLTAYSEAYAFVAKQIRKEIKEGSQAGQIAVLTKSNSQRNAVLGALGGMGIPALTVDRNAAPDGARVSLMTVHAAKGLDFVSVYLLDIDVRRAPIDLRRGQLYVALTRSSRNLCIVRLPTFEPSPTVLDDLNPDCYESVDP